MTKESFVIGVYLENSAWGAAHFHLLMVLRNPPKPCSFQQLLLHVLFLPALPSKLKSLTLVTNAILLNRTFFKM